MGQSSHSDTKPLRIYQNMGKTQTWTKHTETCMHVYQFLLRPACISPFLGLQHFFLISRSWITGKNKWREQCLYMFKMYVTFTFRPSRSDLYFFLYGSSLLAWVLSVIINTLRFTTHFWGRIRSCRRLSVYDNRDSSSEYEPSPSPPSSFTYVDRNIGYHNLTWQYAYVHETEHTNRQSVF